MTNETRPSVDMLHKLIRLDATTGRLYWRRRMRNMFENDDSWKVWNKRFADQETFTSKATHGYLQGNILGKPQRAHRVVFALVNGHWPEGEIDHINQIKTDNRPDNLRDVSHAENCRNQKLFKNNTSGYPGVCWSDQASKWYATIKVDNQSKFLGYSSDIADAISARKKAEKEFGFHENHGGKSLPDQQEKPK